jgi:hypothetical protein
MSVDDITTVQQLYALAICFAQSFDKNEDIVVNTDKYFRPFHKRISACYQPNSSFFDATNCTLLIRSMPSAMRSIVEELDMWKGRSDERPSDLFRCGYLAAFGVGDGCTHVAKNGQIKQTLAIKDWEEGDINVKRYLRNHGWKNSRKKNKKSEQYDYIGLSRYVDITQLQDYNTCLANHYLLSFKRYIWSSIIAFAALAPPGQAGQSNDLMVKSRQALSIICSMFNQTHGCYFPTSFYMSDFRRMTGLPCFFDVFIAGIIGSDGSVGINLDYSIYQSIRRFMVAFSTVMNEKYGLSTVVIKKKSKTIRWRPSYTIRMNSEDTRKMILRVASYDLNRADQQLVLLLRIMVKHAKGVPNKKRVQAFLKGLGKYIRKVRPS